MAGTDLWTVQKLLRWTIPYFQKHHIEEARLDAELLLAHVLGKPRIYLYTNYDQMMNREELARFKALIKQRVDGCCTAVLIGTKEFMGIPFKVNAHVLVPRPDTEAWVEKIIQEFRPVPDIEMADLCTGSGAIAVSFLSFCKSARAVATDISPEALQVARENGESAGVSGRLEFREGDLLGALKEGERFDVILTNPPYIPEGDIDSLAVEVRHEPRIALSGGSDGLDFYRRLAEGVVPFLKPGGLLAAEVGMGQAEAVKTLFAAAGLTGMDTIKDYGGIDRAVCGRRPAAADEAEKKDL